MHSIQVYIDETLSEKYLLEIKKLLLAIPHVTNVEVNSDTPHDVMVEYEAHHNIPMEVVEKLNGEGLHSDIISA